MGYPDWTAPMVWVLQEGELWPIEQWVARQGEEKRWYATGQLLAWESVYVIDYTVPAKKKLYLARLTTSGTDDMDTTLYYYDPAVYLSGWFSAGRRPYFDRFAPPHAVVAGKGVRVLLVNATDAAISYVASLLAFEHDVD